MATNYLLTIPGFTGPYMGAGLKGSYPLESFSTSAGASIIVGLGSVRVGQPMFNGIQITLPMSSDLVNLFSALCGGQHVDGFLSNGNIVVTVLTSGAGPGKPQLLHQLTIGNVYVQSFTIESASPELALSVELVFTKLQVESWPLLANGSRGNPVKFGFDISTGLGWYP